MIRRVLLGLLIAGAGCAGDGRPDRRSRDAPSTGPEEPVIQTSPVSSSAPSEGAHDSATDEDEVYPLKDWMAANLARPVKAEDFAALEQALANLAAMAPDEFPDWRVFAKAGASAAAAKNIDGVRASCADCHQKYRGDYRETMRTRPLPEMRSAR